jgi:hypothetical protein
MADNGSNLSLPSQALGVIPHFFYDVIGRIIPGTFVIISLFEMFGLPSQLKFLTQLATPTKDLTAYLIFLGASWFLVMIVAGYFVGFMLAALAYEMCEKWLVKDRGKFFFRPLSLNDFVVLPSKTGHLI